MIKKPLVLGMTNPTDKTFALIHRSGKPYWSRKAFLVIRRMSTIYLELDANNHFMNTNSIYVKEFERLKEKVAPTPLNESELDVLGDFDSEK